jgi:hypothetical protein
MGPTLSLIIIFILTRQKFSFTFRAISLALHDLKRKTDLSLLELTMEMDCQKDPFECGMWECGIRNRNPQKQENSELFDPNFTLRILRSCPAVLSSIEKVFTKEFQLP